MKPVVSVSQMRDIDVNSSVDEATLIERAGRHVARVAKQMMAGTYGRHVLVVAGPGNNGADGRVAGELLRLRGARVSYIEPGSVDTPDHADLVIDAAFGTGFHGEYKAPWLSEITPVLAVDIPSGVNGDTGVACAGAVVADVTVTFAAYKPGHFLNDGPDHCGAIELCDIGLDIDDSQIELVELDDVRASLGTRLRDSHKWKTALAIVAGSPGMMGAPTLAATSAARSGAGMVRLLLPGVEPNDLPIGEAVASSLPRAGWDAEVLAVAERVHAVVVGPGLGRDDETVGCVRRLAERLGKPLVIDADGLFAIGDATLLRGREAPTILTPHDGEFARITGNAPTDNRIADARTLARSAGVTVLLKGSTTIVASPNGQVLLNNTGSSRLATAGTGDVLSGMVGAFLARGLDPDEAAAFAAHIHGLAALQGYSQGLVAGDLPELVAEVLSNV